MLREEDIALAIADTEKLIWYSPDKSNPLHAKIGSPIQKGAGIELAIREKRMITKTIPKETFGIPSRTIAIPITDDQGEIVGAIAFGVSLVRQSKLSDIAEDLVEAISRISDSTGKLSETTSHLKEAQDTMSITAKDARDQVQATSKVTEIVKRIASQSNILGLNAGIEATRAGANGRAFQVVANEVRKLANESVNAVQQVEDRIDKMKKAVETILTQTSTVDASVLQQSMEFQELKIPLKASTGFPISCSKRPGTSEYKKRPDPQGSSLIHTLSDNRIVNKRSSDSSRWRRSSCCLSCPR